MTNTAVTWAYNYQQCSQKNNTKFTKWQEVHENDRWYLFEILNETVYVDFDAVDGHPQGARRSNEVKEGVQEAILMHNQPCN